MTFGPLSQAQRTLVEANVNFVKFAVSRHLRSYPAQAQAREDMEQDAYVAMCRAALTYRVGSAAKFITFASLGIETAIKNAGLKSRAVVGPMRKGNGGTKGVAKPQAMVYLDAPLPVASGRHETAERDGVVERYAPSDSFDPSDILDAESLRRRVVGALEAEASPRDVKVFLAMELEGASSNVLAAELGICGQRVRQVAKNVRPHFDAWARALRSEAA